MGKNETDNANATGSNSQFNMSSSESISEMGEGNINRPVLLDSGDLQLHFEYSNQSLTLQGSSRALSLVSPVWYKILNPPFRRLVSKEGNNNGKQEKNIDFSEDNGEALLILLRITHLQFSKVPSTLKSFDTFLALAILCDKYDCVGLMKPWLEPWVGNDGIEFKWDEPGFEPWLFIAWVLGWKNRFRSLATKLVRTVQINDAGETLNRHGDVLPGQMPPDIIESILSIRHDTIHELLKLPYDYIDLFDRSVGSVCPQAYCSKECDAMAYGSLLRGLQEFDLWPRKSADTIKISVNDLASQLQSLGVYVYPTNDFSDHFNCNLVIRFRDQIASTLSSIPNPVLDSHRRHMRIQATK